MFSVHTRLARVTYARNSALSRSARCSRCGWVTLCVIVVAMLVSRPTSGGAQVTARAEESRNAVRPAPSTESATVDSLTATAIERSPAIRAARARVEAAWSRVGPAGLRPDPMLMVGVQNLPVSDPGFRAEMTMKMVGVGQTIPYPGKLALNRRVSEREVRASEAALMAVQHVIVRDVRSAYYELAFLDRAVEIAERNRDILVSLIAVSEARYGSGVAGQQDVLKARVEAGRLAETAVGLTERRRAALARLNALLDRSSDSPVDDPGISPRIARAAVADSASDVRFVSVALGARAADSPLPSVEALQALALRESPMLREAEAMVAAQAARAELAGLASLPDFDVSLQYGQRSGYPDMVSATVSVPLPLQKRQKQHAQAAEMRADLSAREAERHTRQNEILAEVARLHSELERDRAQLALYVRSIIPQGQASLASATSSYQAGRIEFMTVLDNQATVFTYELEYFRLLSEFATMLAELEQVVGQEILP